MYITRKVYSQAEDIETGEIKLFSVNDVTLNDNYYGNDYDDYYEDRRYSVMMDEDELALFSDLQEYLYSDDNEGGMSRGAKIGLGVGSGVATAAGIAIAAKKGWLGKAAQGQYERAAAKAGSGWSKATSKFRKAAPVEEKALTKEELLAANSAKYKKELQVRKAAEKAKAASNKAWTKKLDKYEENLSGWNNNKPFKNAKAAEAYKAKVAQARKDVEEWANSTSYGLD